MLFYYGLSYHIHKYIDTNTYIKNRIDNKHNNKMNIKYKIKIINKITKRCAA